MAKSIACLGSSVTQERSQWGDVQRAFEQPVSFAGGVIHITAEFISNAPMQARIALVDDSDPNERSVTECYVAAIPGVWSTQLDTAHFRTLHGKPDLSRINLFLFGGEMKKTPR